MSIPKFAVVVTTLAQVFSTSALAQSADPAIAEVIVQGARINVAKNASAGGFSDAALLDTPASIDVITRQQMDDLRIRSSTEAMKTDASVSDSYNAIGYAENFSIRGFDLDNNASYRKDGFAISGDTQIPLENKERIEVLKGLAGLQAGVAAPGGVIDYIVKRPSATALRSLTVEASERGTLYGAVDLGGRFDDPRFGYRINAALEQLRSYVKGADGERKFISGALDWQLTPQALLQLDMDYQYKAQVTVPGFQLINNATLPTGIAADTMLNNQSWSMPVTTRSSNIGLRFAYQFDPAWHATLSANRHSFKRDDYAAFPYGCSSQNLAPGFCANGDYDVYDYRSLGETKSPLALQALLQGKFTAAALLHDVTLGASFYQRSDHRFGTYLYTMAGTSNIYHPVAVAPADSSAAAPVTLYRHDQESAVFAQDIVSLNRQWTLHAGLRTVRVSRDQIITDDNGADAGEVKLQNTFVLPNLALVYQAQNNLSLYGAYAQGLEHGGIAPQGTNNQFSALDPDKSSQVEAGVKLDLTREVQLAAALFEIRKGLEYTDASNTFVRNGTARNRGLELSAKGRLTADLSLGFTAMALNTTQAGTGLADTDGKRVTNVPAFKSALYADYKVAQVAGLKLNSTWLYSGKKAFDQENTLFVPGYSVFNLGAAYATTVIGTATILRANVDNVFDKFYWRDVTPAEGGYLFPGAIRTFKVSAQFDF